MLKKDAKDTVKFGPPVVDPGVPPAAMPATAGAAAYGQEARERRKKAALPQYNAPVGGGPPVPIPRLDSQFQAGMTMADAATQQVLANLPEDKRAALLGPQHPQPPMALAPMGNPFLELTKNLLPSDILPEAARQDPAFMTGMGSMSAQTQPMLAAKYGVIRNGRHLAPQELRTGKPGLSPQSLQGLQQLQQLQARQQAGPSDPDVARHMDSEERKAEADAAAGPAGAAARLANAPGDKDIRPAGADKKRSLEQLDDLDWGRLRDAMRRDLLNNDEQREIIEARLEPMDVSDLILHQRVHQIVPVIPGKVEYEFQSTTGQEDLALKRLLMADIKSLDVSDGYINDKFALMAACLGLVSVNKLPLPSHLDEDGNFSDDKFWVKFNVFVRQSLHMLASIGINYFWFDVRVRKLFVAEKVKNG